MQCKSCQSPDQTLFPSEICIHFPGGLKALDKRHVMIYPQILVCLKCGFAEFSISKAELRRLAESELRISLQKRD
jgi:hypothetical protein